MQDLFKILVDTNKVEVMSLQEQILQDNPFACTQTKEWEVIIKCIDSTNVEDHVLQNQMSPRTRHDSILCLLALPRHKRKFQ